MTRKLVLVAGIALVLRLAAVIPLHATGYTSDEKEYLMLAQKVAAGQEFMDSDGEYSKRYPLYPFILGGLISIFGDVRWVMHLFTACLAATVPVLCGLVARQIWPDDKIAVAAAWAAALYPGLVVYGAVLQTESLYVVLLLTAFLLAFRLAEKSSIGNAAGLGLVGGLTTLTRAVFLGFFPILLVLLYWMQRRSGTTQDWRAVGASALVFLLALIPWTWRNFEVHGSLIPISSVGGHLILIGNNPYATGTWSTRPGFDAWYRDELRAREIPDPARLSEVERGRVAGLVGLDYMITHPLGTARRAVTKAHIFWFYPITNSDSNAPLQGVAVLADMFLYVAAVLGLLRMKDARGRLLPVFGALLFFAVLPLILHAEARYRLPLVPFLCMIAAWAALPTMTEESWRGLLLGNRLLWAVAGVAGIAVVYAITAWMVLRGSIAY